MLIIAIVTAVLFVLKVAGLATCSWWMVFSVLLGSYVVQLGWFFIALVLFPERIKSFTFWFFPNVYIKLTFRG